MRVGVWVKENAGPTGKVKDGGFREGVQKKAGRVSKTSSNVRPQVAIFGCGVPSRGENVGRPRKKVK